MDFTKTFNLLLDFFIKERMEFALVGGFALNVYGMTRTTNDIDILLEETSSTKVIPFLESLGYQTLYRSEAFQTMSIPWAWPVLILYMSPVKRLKKCSLNRGFSHYFQGRR